MIRLFTLLLLITVLSTGNAQAADRDCSMPTTLWASIVKLGVDNPASTILLSHPTKSPELFTLLYTLTAQATPLEWHKGPTGDGSNWWTLADESEYRAENEKHPYLISFRAGFDDGGRLLGELLVGASDRYPEYYFLYALPDFHEAMRKGKLFHPDCGAWYIDRRIIDDLYNG